jgi:hypothetical protein
MTAASRRDGIKPADRGKVPMKLSIKDDPTRGPKVEIEEDSRDILVMVNGVTIARRCYPDTPVAGTWVSLEPGWSVISSEDLSRIEIAYDGKRVSLTNLELGRGVR